MASYPRTWSKLATIATRLSKLQAAAGGSASELQTLSEGKKFVERIVGGHTASKGLYRRLRCLVYNNRKGWNRVVKERIEFQAYSAHAWYLLMLYKLNLISDEGVNVLLRQPLGRILNDERDEKYRKFLTIVRDDYERRFGGADNSGLWTAINEGVYELHDKCMIVASEQRTRPQHRAVQTNANETAIDWIQQHRRIHEFDGMLFLYERGDEIHCELEDIIRKGDIEQLVPVYHEFNHIAWALEWTDLRDRCQEAIIDALNTSSLSKRFPLHRENTIIQGVGYTGALRALLNGKGINFAMDNPNLICELVDEWDELLVAAEKDVKSRLDRRLYLANLSSASRFRGYLTVAEDLDLARSHFHKGMDYALRAGIESKWLAVVRGYACVLRNNKRPAEAFELLRRGIAVAVRQGNSRRVIQFSLEAAELLIDQGQLDSANLMYTQAEAIFNRIQGLIGEPWYQPTWRLELARVEKLLGGLADNESGNAPYPPT